MGGYIANSAALEKGSYNVPDLELDVEDIMAEGKDNASVTILAKDSEDVIRILLESEDHSQRSIFAVRLGKEDTASDDPNDASRDYPYGDMTLRAPSVESGGLYHGPMTMTAVPSGIQIGAAVQARRI